MKKKLDEQTILNKIREEILFKSKECDEDNINIFDYRKQHLDNILTNINNMNDMWIIVDQPLVDTGNLGSKLKKIIKRCIRKSVYWLLKPYVEQQTRFNAEIVKSISEIYKILNSK